MSTLHNIDALRERYRRTARAFEVLDAVVPDMIALLEAGIERVPIEQQLGSLALVDDGVLLQLERNVNAFERSFEELDRKIPTRWFRKHCVVQGHNAAGYADYARVLAQYVGPKDAARLERIRIIVDGITETVWPRASSTVEQRREIAAHALPVSEVNPDVAGVAVAYLTASADRVASFKHLDELVASDFIVETRGWAMALREKALDPAILIANIDLEHAIREKVAALQVKEHLTDAERRLEEVFAKLGEDESATEQGFEAFQQRRAAFKAKQAEEARARTRAERRRKEREQWDPPKRRWPTPVAIAVLAAMVWLRWPSTPSETLLQGDELASYSPVLESASVGPVKRPRVLTGRIEMARWNSLDAHARRGAARDLAVAMRARGLESGTVFNGDSIAMEIRQGEVLVVR